MRLIPHARKAFRRLWSIRVALLAAAIQGAAMFWIAFEGTMPPLWFFGIGVFLTVLVVPVRLIKQADVDET
jgi:fatty acid desaturase